MSDVGFRISDFGSVLSGQRNLEHADDALFPDGSGVSGGVHDFNLELPLSAIGSRIWAATVGA
jgi:hypothetical protein